MIRSVFAGSCHAICFSTGPGKQPTPPTAKADGTSSGSDVEVSSDSTGTSESDNGADDGDVDVGFTPQMPLPPAAIAHTPPGLT